MSKIIIMIIKVIHDDSIGVGETRIAETPVAELLSRPVADDA